MSAPRRATRVPALLAVLLTTALWVACVQEPAPITSVDSIDPALVMPEVDAQEIGEAVRAQNRHVNRIIDRPGVAAMAVGASTRGSGAAVQIYVESADVADLPVELDGVPVEVIVTGPIRALNYQEARGKGNGKGGGGDPGDPGDGGGESTDPTGKFRDPLIIGISTGHPAITAGTIGAKVLSSSGATYALSNNHVFANENTAGQDDELWQPGRYDGGTAADVFGTLEAWVDIDFNGGDNRVDAALASVGIDFEGRTPSDGYGSPSSNIVPTSELSLGTRVTKYGRTTGSTKGRIQGLNATVNVQYDTGVARFVGQLVIGGGGFSSGGDSGSLIVIQNGADAGRPVGLLFAGGGGSTIANPIQDVLTQLSGQVAGTLTIVGN